LRFYHCICRKLLIGRLMIVSWESCYRLFETCIRL
jgi:hypothetical protein